MKTALISVFKKEGIEDFVLELKKMGWNILASRGTKSYLEDEHGIAVRDVSDIVGPPILGRRVNTLSREVHAGILSRAIPEDIEELERIGVPRIDLVCVDMYPLLEEIAREGSTRESIIEKTDVGGPTMLLSAAKAERIVICDPDSRSAVIEFLKKDLPEDHIASRSFREFLCAKAQFVVAEYIAASANYRSGGAFQAFFGEEVRQCAYGENPHQKPAAAFSFGTDDPLAFNQFVQVEGGPPSFNNTRDVDRAVETIVRIAAGFDLNFDDVPLIAVGVKHGSACGAAFSDEEDKQKASEDVLKKMLMGDPEAIYGGVVVVNFPVTRKEAEILVHFRMEADQRRILDTVVAPSFTREALEVLARKKGKCRVLANPALAALRHSSLDQSDKVVQVRGGFLRQPSNQFVFEWMSGDLAFYLQGDHPSLTGRDKDLVLAWAVGSTSISNTITLAKAGQIIGNATGEQSRVEGVKLCLHKCRNAGHSPKKAAVYSDSFFPFPDGPKLLCEAGVDTIFASSGSINDQQTIDVCRAHGVNLLMIPDKIGRGFLH